MKKWITKNGYNVTQLLSGRSNVFLVDAVGIRILIDTSTKRNWKKLDRRLHSLQIHTIDYLILTHTHYDHCANAAKLKEKYNAKIILHTSEEDNLMNGLAILPNGTNLFTSHLIRFGRKFQRLFDFEPCMFDVVVDDEMDLNSIGLNGFILHTPGHSKGSISIIIDNEITIVGDTLFGIFLNSVFPPYADDLEILMDSWEKLLSVNCNLFLPSHGKPINRKQLNDCYFTYKN